MDFKEIIVQLDKLIPGWKKLVDLREPKEVTIFGETRKDLAGKAYNDLEDQWRVESNE